MSWYLLRNQTDHGAQLDIRLIHGGALMALFSAIEVVPLCRGNRAARAGTQTCCASLLLTHPMPPPTGVEGRPISLIALEDESTQFEPQCNGGEPTRQGKPRSAPSRKGRR